MSCLVWLLPFRPVLIFTYSNVTYLSLCRCLFAPLPLVCISLESLSLPEVKLHSPCLVPNYSTSLTSQRCPQSSHLRTATLNHHNIHKHCTSRKRPLPSHPTFSFPLATYFWSHTHPVQSNRNPQSCPSKSPLIRSSSLCPALDTPPTAE